MLTLDLTPLDEGVMEVGAIAIVKVMYPDGNTGYVVKYNNMDDFEIVGLMSVEGERFKRRALEWEVEENG